MALKPFFDILIDMRNKKIGIFDSGFGGLTILSGIKKILPDYDYIYLGDTARAPYGSRPQNEIYKFSKQAVDYLFQEGCEIIIFACNTASSEALRKIQQEYLPKKYPEKKVLGVLIPACEKAVEDGNKKIGVMATKSTVDSDSYIRELKKLDKTVVISQVACPDLVTFIEKGDINSRAFDESLDRYLAQIEDVDAIILGCTHYEIIENKIKQKAGKIEIISQSQLVSEKLKNYFERHSEIEKKLLKNKNTTYYTTGCEKKFSGFAKKIAGEKITTIKIDL